MMSSLFDRPAVLFLPASNERAIAKARASAADMVILDLQDAVRAEDKDRARELAVKAVSDDWSVPVVIRINEIGNTAHGADLAAMLRHKTQQVVLPSVRTADEVHGVSQEIGHPVLAMIETASAVLNVREIAKQAAGLIVGTNDLAADLRLPAGAGRQSMSMALQMIVLAARSEGKPVFDGVYNRIDDLDGFAAEAAESRALGFDGKTLIHPSQIEPCQLAFAPSVEELERAERLVSAASGGAERFEGSMIEEMHVEAARRLLARPRRS
jgi:citrate lyase subunit beta/citryl-CoA lyase